MDSNRQNALGQPIGWALPSWAPPPRPPRTPIAGRYVCVEPIDVERHAADLFQSQAADTEGRNWTYLPYGPFATEADYRAWMAKACLGDDPMFHVLIDTATGRAVGVASYLRIDPPNGAIEVGHINFTPALQGTRGATESMCLMMHRAFSLGYRRYEWKCDAVNLPSRVAAARLGFSFEGVFRQAAIYKGRNRDTAWYSVLDSEWPALERAFLTWLDPGNFDAAGGQRVRLSDLTRPLLASRG